jgi:hypothetical protein
MLPPLASALVRTGLALKISQMKRATESYVRDRSDQAQGTAVSYAVAAGLYAAAGIFAIALLLVGVAALFRWVELNYGLFPAFGVSAAILLVLAIACAALAASRLKKPARQFPSLTSRLRVAIRANPVRPDQVDSARDTATAVLMATPSPRPANEFKPSRPPRRAAVSSGREAKAGLLLAATLAGWALVRRRTIAKNMRPARRAPRPGMDKANA